MSEAAAPQRERGPEPVVVADGEFAGLLRLRGPARIDGAVVGEVISEGSVWIGATARVRARIEAREVVVAGELQGEIRASEKIELLPSARVKAVLATPRLVLADGSYFEGRCETLDSSQASPAANSAAETP